MQTQRRYRTCSQQTITRLPAYTHMLIHAPMNVILIVQHNAKTPEVV